MPRIDDDGAGGTAPIRYPSVLQTLGLDYEQNWTGTTHDALKTVQYSVTTETTFGDIPSAKSFASVYTAAQHIYEATLRGIREDLVAAATALAQAHQEIQDRDEASGDAFRTLEARWNDGDNFSASQNNAQASQDDEGRAGSEAQVTLAEGAPAPEGDGPADGGSDGTMPTDATTPGQPASEPGSGGDDTGMQVG
ncbi:hypothetical protein [Phycicoccus sonneratiae]|uniref:Uncharacterized protein n=1 Tax=Phycicoccus sonneratiae TaxID=2807628 RepID=A0ABS2CGQ3_9MICO|nr:hypothetical protein [Phycicoccus sonneraticus]MBM6399050.1 hypothetical protein [Phycicoccus sonneraticus]